MYYTKDNKGIITNGTFSYEENLLNLVSTSYNYQSYVFTDILRFENSELLASQSVSSSNGDL